MPDSVFSDVPGLCPLGISRNPHPSVDSLECFQASPNIQVGGESKTVPVEEDWIKGIQMPNKNIQLAK